MWRVSGFIQAVWVSEVNPVAVVGLKKDVRRELREEMGR